MKIGAKIALHRKKAGFSQEELAMKLNISRQAVSRWETGEAVPDTERIVLLSRLFAVSTDYLLLDEVEDEPDAKRHESDQKDLLNAAQRAKSRRNGGIALLACGVACIVIGIVLAGVYTENSILPDAFQTALFLSWRSVFLYVGIVLTVASAWGLLALGRRIKTLCRKIKTFPHKRELVLSLAMLFVICFWLVGYVLSRNGILSGSFSPLAVLLLLAIMLIVGLRKKGK